MNEPVYSVLLILVIYLVWLRENKIWRKSKKLRGNRSSIVYIKIEDIHVDIAQDIKTRFNNSNYNLKDHFPRELGYWINER